MIQFIILVEFRSSLKSFKTFLFLGCWQVWFLNQKVTDKMITTSWKKWLIRWLPVPLVSQKEKKEKKKKKKKKRKMITTSGASFSNSIIVLC